MSFTLATLIVNDLLRCIRKNTFKVWIVRLLIKLKCFYIIEILFHLLRTLYHKLIWRKFDLNIYSNGLLFALISFKTFLILFGNWNSTMVVIPNEGTAKHILQLLDHHDGFILVQYASLCLCNELSLPSPYSWPSVCDYLKVFIFK